MDKEAMVNKLVCDDVDEYSDLFDGWTHRTIQTEPGRFGYKGHSIRLPGLDIHLDQHSRSLRWCEFPHSPVTSIFVPLKCSGSVMWRGQDLSANSIILQGKGEEQHFVVGPQMQAIFIDISRELTLDLGWNKLGNGHMRVLPAQRNKLVRYCLDLAKNNGIQIKDDQNLPIRNTVLRLLHHLFSAPHELKEKCDRNIQISDFEVLLLCEDSLQKSGLAKPPSNADLALEIGVSERRFYRAFENQLGMSPSRYMEILRLHGLRQRLLTAVNANLKIADAMTEFGFSNAGRTAKRYNDLFLEYPKETALRSKRAAF
ncbi:MAG: helix-turn-helix domain-containing protein [Pseudomonadota bacterium]